jgi:hypothetical protein
MANEQSTVRRTPDSGKLSKSLNRRDDVGDGKSFGETNGDPSSGPDRQLYRYVALRDGDKTED